MSEARVSNGPLIICVTIYFKNQEKRSKYEK